MNKPSRTRKHPPVLHVALDGIRYEVVAITLRVRGDRSDLSARTKRRVATALRERFDGQRLVLIAPELRAAVRGGQ
jgi:hypothetical protein